MIILRVLSRRAWTRESGTLFTTTISYRGETDCVASADVGGGGGGTEKPCGCADAERDVIAERREEVRWREGEGEVARAQASLSSSGGLYGQKVGRRLARKRKR